MTIHGSPFQTLIAQKLLKLMKEQKKLKLAKKKKNKTESNEKVYQGRMPIKNLQKRNLKRLGNISKNKIFTILRMTMLVQLDGNEVSTRRKLLVLPMNQAH